MLRFVQASALCASVWIAMGSERKTPLGQVSETRRYPGGACEFILEGLNAAVERVHGPLTPAQVLVAQYMAHEDIDLHGVIERRDEGVLDPAVCKAIDEAGGFEMLNRHVSGQELCWSLRDWALRCWGPLSSVVLRGWGITRTIDFGHVVFSLIESGRLQREPHDRLEDFRDVFDFKEAFDNAYRVEFSN